MTESNDDGIFNRGSFLDPRPSDRERERAA